jgi:hypothetical protein
MQFRARSCSDTTDASKEMCAIIGYKLDEKKESLPSSQLLFLGNLGNYNEVSCDVVTLEAKQADSTISPAQWR